MKTLTLLDIRDYFDGIRTALDLVPNFVFSSDEQGLRETIALFGDSYMFVDYGDLTSSLEQQELLLRDSFEMAVTLAHPFGVNSVTNETIMQKNSELFSKMNQLRGRMYKDQRCIPWLKYLSFPNSVSPFTAPDISRSIGFSLIFRTEGYDLFGVR